MTDQLTNRHFWWSDKLQRHLLHDAQNGRNRRRLFAEIDGKEVEYNAMTETEQHGHGWDDMQYLGKGDFKRTGDYL